MATTRSLYTNKRLFLWTVYRPNAQFSTVRVFEGTVILMFQHAQHTRPTNYRKMSDKRESNVAITNANLGTSATWAFLSVQKKKQSHLTRQHEHRARQRMRNRKVLKSHKQHGVQYPYYANKNGLKKKKKKKKAEAGGLV